MGGFSFAPRRRARGTWWQLVLAVFRILQKIFTVHLTDTQQVEVDLFPIQEVTVNLISTESIDIEVENC